MHFYDFKNVSADFSNDLLLSHTRQSNMNIFDSCGYLLDWQKFLKSIIFKNNFCVFQHVNLNLSNIWLKNYSKQKINTFFKIIAKTAKTRRFF